MSNRNSKKPEPVGDAVATGEAGSPAAPAEPRWTVQPWHAHQLLQCRECPFSTLDEDRMEEHLRVNHPRRPPAAPTAAQE